MQTLRACREVCKRYLAFKRGFSTSHKNGQKKALILGVYTSKEESPQAQDAAMTGTRAFEKYDGLMDGKLGALLGLSKPIKPGTARVYHGVGHDQTTVAIVSLGERDSKDDDGRDGCKESIRKAMGAGIKSLSDLGIEKVEVDTADQPNAAAEGVFLSSWAYKRSDRDKVPSDISPLNDGQDPGWIEGKIMAESQNFARYLMESPANLMNPSIFADTAKEKLESSSGKVKVLVRDEDWIKKQSMGAFLSVAQGSDQPPKFLEIHYKGSGTSSEGPPLVLVGKGITFDSGGISIKPSKGMDEMRADMGGAATVTSSILTAAMLNTPGDVIGLIPLCENMPSGRANRPGDVVIAKDGTTVQIDNTDAEGRLILADALCYCREFRPAAVVDVATLTGAVVVALGAGATGAFTNCDRLWDMLDKAGRSTGDRMWRMPLYQLYVDQVKPSHLADLNNVGKASGAGGSCTAAAFLRHFIQSGTPWAHLDIAGVMTNNMSEVPYLTSGMTGRPTRTLAEFIKYYHTESH